MIDKSPLKKGLDDPDQGVVDNPVLERWGLDVPLFGLVHGKPAGVARLPGFPEQMVLQVDKIFFQMNSIIGNLSPVPLALASRVICGCQVFEINHVLK
jgi:hypothetical protein